MKLLKTDADPLEIFVLALDISEVPPTAAPADGNIPFTASRTVFLKTALEAIANAPVITAGPPKSAVAANFGWL